MHFLISRKPIILKKGFPTLFVLFLFSTSHLNAQCRIFGEVTSNGIPILGATLLIREDSLSQIQYFGISKDDGTYAINYNGNKKSILIEVNAINYKSVLKKIEILRDTVKNINFDLQIEDKILPEVIIRTQPAIQVHGDTTIFKIDSFITSNETNVTKLLEKLPGFLRGPRGSLLYNGKLISKVLIQNSDLLGSDYGSFISKLGIGGIDKVEVIKNYRDNENIANQLNKEQVVNLIFKNNFLSKLFGETSLNIASKTKHYALKGQAILLFNKIKLIYIDETTSNNPILEDFKIPNFEKESISEITLIPYQYLSTIDNQKAQLFKSLFITEHFEKTSKIVSKYWVSKKITISTSLNFENNIFSQQNNSIQKYLNINPSFEINQFSKLNKRKSIIDPTFTFNYRPNLSNQFVVALHSESNHFTFRNHSNFQTNKIEEVKLGRNNQYAAKLTYNHTFKLNMLSIETTFKKLHSKTDYIQTPSLLKDFFNSQIDTATLSQSEFLSSIKWKSKIIYVVKKFNIGIDYSLSKNYFNNKLIFKNDTVYSIPEDVLVNTNVIHKNLTLNFSNQFKFKRFIITPGLKFSSISLTQIILNRKQQNANNKLYALPSLNIDFHPNKKNQFICSISTNVYNSQELNLTRGYYISGLNTINSNSTTPSLKRNFTLNVNYSFSDILIKKFLLYVFYTLNKNPLPTIPNTDPLFYYVLIKNQNFSKSSIQQIASLHFSKFTPWLLRRIEPNFQFLKTKMFTLLKGIESNSIIISSNIGLKLFFRTNKINLIPKTSYSILHQKSLFKNETLTNKTKKYDLSLSFEYQILPNLSFTSIGALHNIYSSNLSTQHLFLIDLKISLSSKNKKWNWAMLANNMSNRKAIKIESINPTQIQTSNFQLFPKLFQIEGTFRF